MSAQNSSPAGALGAFAGMIGLSAIIGLLTTIMVTPAIAVTGMAANNTIGIFDSLPEYIRIDPLSQRNELYAQVSHDPEDGYVKIAEVFSENREEVGYDQIAETVIHATLAAEDRRFYSHGGIDLQGIVRAATNNFVAGDITGGGSTLTQQLVKNIFINQAIQQFPPGEERNEAVRAAQETTLERKLNEAKLAISLEKQYTKDEIMLAYLNIAGFGGNTYGIEAAAQQYFGITAAELDVAQAASLLAIVQQPSARSLLREENYAANERRRNVIINSMYDEGFITASERDEAINTPVDADFVNLSTPRSGCIAADEYAKFMCDYVVNLVPELEALGSTEEERETAWRQGGFEVYTTLDMSLQKVAQDTVWNVVPADARSENADGQLIYDVGGSSVSVESNTGRILTMAQNKRFDNSLEGGGVTTTAVNYNTDRPYGGSSGFQTGSTYKIFALVEWLEEGRGLQEFIDGSPSRFEQSTFTDSCNGPHSGAVWEPRNFAGAGGGVMSVLQATVNSVNTSFAAIAQQLDQCAIADTAERLGVRRADGGELQTNPSAVLGTNEISPLRMAAAFGAIQNGGRYCEPIAVDRLVDRNGTELTGQVSECRQAIDEDVAAATTFAMREVVTRGTGQASNPGGDIPVVGKTGTSDNARHTWMVGGSTRIGTAAWVGNAFGELDINNLPGGGGMRHEIFRPIMAAANATYGGDALPEVPDRLLRGQGVNLPDVTGQDPEVARGIIEGLGFRFFVEEARVDSALAEGLIATQNPAPGTFLSLGTPVRVQLSAGNQAVMPDVVSPGYTLEEARAVLEEAGFTNISVRCETIRRQPGPSPEPPGDGDEGEDEVIEDPVDPGPSPGDNIVIDQNRAAGETFTRNTLVRITVQRDSCR
ncbi:transglycosylase domain-containing protein [Microcella sp.]|uniref:transglycosylase domain-containing protein n=1 Tax=Microcella sp. TaxID=1913979 RepID=UPI003919CB30